MKTLAKVLGVALAAAGVAVSAQEEFENPFEMQQLSEPVATKPLVTPRLAGDGTWKKCSSFLRGRIYHSAVWTYSEMIVWGGGSEHQFYNDGGVYDPTTDFWRAVTTKGAPSGRWGHAAVWTGREMIVWGGRSSFSPSNHKADGAIYDPRSDQWRPMSSVNAPRGRSQMAAVWTGNKLIVWGGWSDDGKYLADGAIYDLRDDRWSAISSEDAPEARMEPGVVWTGREMIVWGGLLTGGDRSAGTGGCYDPEKDSWRPVSNAGAPPSSRGLQGVWTGSEMIVWGGAHLNGDSQTNVGLTTGGRYNPVTDSWRLTSTVAVPEGRMYYGGVWTDREFLLWSGGDQVKGNVQTGGRYDPQVDQWIPISKSGAPAGRGLASAVWTGEGMLVFGGSTGGTSAFDETYYYLPGEVRVSP